MAKTETVYTRIDPELKANAEQILLRLGLTPSEAITVFLNQVVLHKGLPLQVKVPEMTASEASSILLQKLREGVDSVINEGWMTVEESKSLLGLK